MVTCLAGTPSALAGFGEASHRTGKPHMARNSQQGVLPTDGLMVLEADPSPSSLQIKPSPGFQLDCRPLGDEARDPGKPCTGAQCVETCGTHRFFSYQGSGGLLHSCGWLTHRDAPQTPAGLRNGPTSAHVPTFSSLSVCCAFVPFFPGV